MWRKWSRIIFPEFQLLDFKKNTETLHSTHQHAVRYETANLEEQVTNNFSVPMTEPSQAAPVLEEKQKITPKRKVAYKKVQQNEIDQLFKLVQDAVNQRVYGQEEYIQELILWFKKQYMLGDNLKNRIRAVSIIGSPGTGKSEGIMTVTKELHQYKLLGYQQVIILDVGIYSERDIQSNFIRDFSSAFSHDAATIIIKGLEKAHQQVVDNLEKLITDGYFRTEAGVLIEAGNHSLAFIAEKERDLSPVIADYTEVLTTKPLELSHLEQIAQEMFFRTLKQIEEITDKQVTIEDDVISFLALLSLKGEGYGRLLKKWITVQLVDQLVALRARNQLADHEKIEIREDALYLIGHDTPLFVPENISGNSVEQAFQELDSLIGLTEVKTFVHELANTVDLQKKRKESGLNTTPLTLHMVFSGNPGTGKTTVARLISHILKGMGVLSKGHLVEVARQDLVGEYVGHTSPKTMAKIQEALGGVLFIDEAYTLSRNQHDSFGQEAIDTLVKGMEDYREDFVVILAGYTQEMEGFLKTNPGLPSRFPFQVEFADYQPEQLFTMLQLSAHKRDYKIDSHTKDSLIGLFERRQIPGRNDSGNGRLVRNVLEEAIRKQAVRVNEENDPNYQLLTLEDFGVEETEAFDLEQELASYIGLSSVKDIIRTLEKQLLANNRRKEAGLEVRTEQVLNMIFSGNPGTGKTTIARTLANMMKELGVLKKGHLVEVGRSELISGYAGQTAEKTKGVVESALGGVLFIDEAYALVDEHGGFGEEAINELVRLMEIHKDNLVVILAGYKEDMNKLLGTNAGLYSRFPLHIDFPDYTATELVQMLHLATKQRGFLLSHDADSMLEEAFRKKQAVDRQAAGNGRMVRNELEAAIRRQSVRIANLTSEDNRQLIQLLPGDFDIDSDIQKVEKAQEQLNEIIGLQSVKNFMQNLFAQIAMNERRKAVGLQENSGQILHMSFIGNPGTGKTTIARIIAKRLYELGVIPANRLVETDRSGLVAGYLGQTALKTKEMIEKAIGGVLFIDEAYSLASDDFGREAIDTIVKAMEDLKGELVVIVAGYEKEMKDFWNSNSGLKSRFPHHILFPNYSAEEMLQIAKIMLKQKGYQITAEAEAEILQQCKHEADNPTSGNGRYVRNLIEASIRKHAVRLVDDNDIPMEELITIIAEDVAHRGEIA